MKLRFLTLAIAAAFLATGCSGYGAPVSSYAVINGQGAPGAVTGNIGDEYIDITTGDKYIMTPAGWQLISKGSSSIPSVAPGIVGDKTLTDLLADTRLVVKDGQAYGKFAYEIFVRIDALGPNYDGIDADKAGHMYVTLADGTGTAVSVSGSGATASALAFDGALGAYVYTSANDFLTNSLTKDLQIGDVLKVHAVRHDYGPSKGIAMVILEKGTRVDPIGPDDPVDPMDAYHTVDMSKVALNFHDVGDFTYYPVLNSVGTQKILVLPIEFRDMPFTDDMIDDIKHVTGGTTEQTGYWESLATFYEKSSYGKLKFEFTYADPIRVGENPEDFFNDHKNEESYEGHKYGEEQYDEEGELVGYPYRANLAEVAMQEAVAAYKTKNGAASTKDFDSDGDGFIDACIMIYSCHNAMSFPSDSEYSKWDDLLWAYKYNDCSLVDEDYRGKHKSSPIGNLYFWASYDFNYEAVGEDSGKVDAHTLCHEMGHVLGADDYYNYSPTDENETAEPSGALMMMHNNIGDHDAFTKLSYGWVNPYVVDGNATITIHPMTSSGECIILADNWNGTCYDEFVIFELYTPDGLNELDASVAYSYRNKMFTTFGVRAFHIDNRLMKFSYDEYAGDWFEDGFMTDTECQNWATLKNTTLADYSLEAGVTNCAYYDAEEIAGKGYELIQIIQAGGTNTTIEGSESTNDDLFQTGDTFTVTAYKEFFPNATSTKATLNNGNALNYTVHFDSVTATGATISFTKGK